MDGFEKEKKRGEKLADAHWKYHEVLMQAIAPATPIGTLGDWYKAIAIHFYMHGVEDTINGNLKEKEENDDIIFNAS